MNRQTRFRFAEWALALALVFLALVWAERMVWNQITNLQSELNVNEAGRLVEFDRNEMVQFLSKANLGLVQLRRLFIGALICLFVSGVVLGLIAYARMVAPLRSRLTESHATIERQEKLASLGIFATGIAHEIRNPLTAIKVRLFSLKQSLPSGSSEGEDIQVIGTEIDRLERIVKDFLQFARPSEPDFKMIKVSELLSEIQGLLTSELNRKSVELKVETSPTHWMIRVDPHRLKQVLLNLIQNAADSMAKGGTVTLSTRTDKRMLSDRPEQVIIIDVADTGAGMPMEIQKRLFDPFFTTKEYGTGLGLPISARIVQKHGGLMEYKTHPNRGTTFSIILPRPTQNET